ncbi:MAG: amidohydrolase family protein [Myxococcota bacterium]
MTRPYRLISADSHVNEPPDLWQSRVAERFRPRAPRVERFAEGDAWILEGVSDPVNFGWNACAGLDPAQMTGWARFDAIRAGGHDPAARLLEMDRDRVDAEVLYPTPRLSQAIISNRDVELHVELVRAYNDWLADYVAHAPERFGGIALLPNVGAKAAVAELERVLGRPGLRGALIGAYPSGGLEPEAEDDAVWARLVEAGWPLDVHVSMGLGAPSAHRSKLPGFGRFYDAPNRMVQMVFSGMFDRFPALQVVFAEVDCGWVPYVKEQMDNNYLRLAPAMGYRLGALPSEYIERHCHFAYISDAFGIDNRQRIGVERMLWSSDYPHISADWPHSWRTIEAAFSGVPRAERDLILAGNAARLYGFGR